MVYNTFLCIEEKKIIIMNILVIIVFVLMMIWGIIFLRYRMSYSKSIVFESEVKYVMIELGQQDFYRHAFESLMGKKKVWIKDGFIDIAYIYVDRKNDDTIYPENPFEMKQKNYTMQLQCKIKPLVFGGYSPATIISCQSIKGEPLIRKS